MSVITVPISVSHAAGPCSPVFQGLHGEDLQFYTLRINHAQAWYVDNPEQQYISYWNGGCWNYDGTPYTGFWWPYWETTPQHVNFSLFSEEMSFSDELLLPAGWGFLPGIYPTFAALPESPADGIYPIIDAAPIERETTLFAGSPETYNTSHPGTFDNPVANPFIPGSMCKGVTQMGLYHESLKTGLFHGQELLLATKAGSGKKRGTGLTNVIAIGLMAGCLVAGSLGASAIRRPITR